MADGIDNLILGFDRALKTLAGRYSAQRPSPAQGTVESNLGESERKHAAGLMRVNHAGEICAQALYEGQALTAKSTQAREILLQAASEERDHLAWCKERLDELESQPSVLDPLFYGASYMMGALTGMAGDKVSLGFVEATEDQVVAHLEDHLERLPEADEKSRVILDQMREDEYEHGAHALEMGGEEFPTPVKKAMSLISKVMTQTTYRI